MKPYARSQRVSGHIQKVLSDVLQKHVKDPRLEMIVITGVKVSRDLRTARIYYITSSSGKNTAEATEGFKSALGYVKRQLSRELGLRYMPDLKFLYDKSFDYGSQIDNILKTLETNNGSTNRVR